MWEASLFVEDLKQRVFRCVSQDERAVGVVGISAVREVAIIIGP